jgi:hypothetical protein
VVPSMKEAKLPLSNAEHVNVPTSLLQIIPFSNTP